MSSASVSGCRPLLGSRTGCEMAIDRSSTDAQGSGDLCQRMLLRVIHLTSERDFGRRHARRAAARAASSSRGCQSGQRALADEVALELRQGAEEVKDELAPRRGRIDVLLQTAEADIAPLEIGDRVDQMTQRTSQTVELLDDEGVGRPQLVEDFRRLRERIDNPVVYAAIPSS
jgi:hypothetical protein